VTDVEGGLIAPAATAGPRSAAAVAQPAAGFSRRLLKQPVAAVCIAYLGLLILVGVVAPLLLPSIAGQQAGSLSEVLKGPSGAHWLGTDSLGRDVLERLLVGTRPVLVGVAEAIGASLVIGPPLGLLAGYRGGTTDRVIGWLADLMFSLPGIVIILVVLAIFPENMLAAMITLGFLVAPSMIRVVRSAALPVRSEPYIEAAKISGFSDLRIMVREVLPRIAGPIIVQMSLAAAAAVGIQVGVAFLGLLVPTPAPSWGGMIADGWSHISSDPWLILPPAALTAATILSLGLLGDAVRDTTAGRWASGPQAVGGTRSIRTREERGPRISSASAADGVHPGHASAGKVLAVEGLSVATDAGVLILDDVSFDIAAGETLALLGESGCGKTMTGRAILGLLPTGITPTAGSIYLKGENLTSLPEKALARVRGRRIAMIGQDPMVSLNPLFRAGWQVQEIVCRHRDGISKSEARDVALDLLRQVDLDDAPDVFRRYPHELSGGMAQRVSIARALAGNPELLIADEPTTALDVSVQAEILALLRRLEAERNMAVLLVTHDWGVVAELADRAVVMYAGEIVEVGQVEQIFARPSHPYTAGLTASSPHYASKKEALRTIPGSVPRPGDWPAACRFSPRCDLSIKACETGPIALVEAESGSRKVRCVRHAEFAERTAR